MRLLYRITPALVLLLGLLAGPVQARPAGAGKESRPNILVIMTDDMAATDVAPMPNVKRLLASQGTTFANTVDSFPLCCPSRATFSPASTPTTTAWPGTSIPTAGTA